MEWWGVGDVVSVSITLWPHQSVSRRRRLQVTIIMLTSCTWLQHRYKGRLLHVGPTGKSEKVTSTRIAWLSLLFLSKTLWREKTNTTRSCYNLTPLFEIMLTGSLLECPISTEDWVAIMTIIHRNHNIIMKWYASRNYVIVYESVSNPGAWHYWECCWVSHLFSYLHHQMSKHKTISYGFRRTIRLIIYLVEISSRVSARIYLFSGYTARKQHLAIWRCLERYFLTKHPTLACCSLCQPSKKVCNDNINQLIMAFSYITLTFQKTKD